MSCSRSYLYISSEECLLFVDDSKVSSFRLNWILCQHHPQPFTYSFMSYDRDIAINVLKLKSDCN